MCDRWQYVATAVRRPTERSGHVVVCNLTACIVAYETTTARDQAACPQSRHVVTAGTRHVVTRFAASLAFSSIQVHRERKRRWVSRHGGNWQATRRYERSKVPALFRPLAQLFLAQVRLRVGERGLDVACGTGIVARLAAPQVGLSGGVRAS
jgi:hypothetical protein